jgi:hypothetical protein
MECHGKFVASAHLGSVERTRMWCCVEPATDAEDELIGIAVKVNAKRWKKTARRYCAALEGRKRSVVENEQRKAKREGLC